MERAHRALELSPLDTAIAYLAIAIAQISRQSLRRSRKQIGADA
jgi:hypothetical protein